MIHCPRCGARLEQRIAEGKPRAFCPACSSFRYQNPAPVAACIVEYEQGIVLIRRGNEPGLGKWALPAGFVDYDENVEHAAVRETREETGLDVRLLSLVAVLSYVEPGKNGLAVVYRATPVGGELRAGDDAIDAQVFLPDRLPELAFDTHVVALERWQTHAGAPLAG